MQCFSRRKSCSWSARWVRLYVTSRRPAYTVPSMYIYGVVNPNRSNGLTRIRRIVPVYISSNAVIEASRSMFAVSRYARSLYAANPIKNVRCTTTIRRPNDYVQRSRSCFLHLLCVQTGPLHLSHMSIVVSCHWHVTRTLYNEARWRAIGYS